MKIIDLTHYISPDMPVYPGTEPPVFDPANTYEKDHFKETRISMFTHTGTHMDPPAHIIKGGKTLDEFDVSQFVGKAVVIECSELTAGQKITMEHINKCRDMADKAEFLLFNTGWDRYWGQDEYFGDFPCIDDEVAEYIISTEKKGVGLDTISLDPIASLRQHNKVLKKNSIVIIENLEKLELVKGGMFTFCALPLKHTDADGSPIRAIAIID